ncbi:hypothetical protein BX600DRAFT_221432 [Xylariales sp. PMI_506]|nr:hypothetical protein BX600DRAFT_221432 [Xylariales sp. PMI_506]
MVLALPAEFLASELEKMASSQPYVTIRSRRPADGSSMSSVDSTVRGNMPRFPPRNRSGLLTSVQYGSSAGDDGAPSAATHDISRVSYHVKHLSDFAKTLEDSAARAFPNRGRSLRYQKVQALLLHWKSDDLFVLPELEDLEHCFREDYSFETEVFPIPSDNAHLELMMRVGQMIKEHESSDTLFIIYYGGHARIDESRQSTWCATRNTDSPWLQWSAIQTLLERSLSDVLILLDCCAGAASATFPNGNSITETISASSWDAIAPDPGRYSFTNVLIEVLQEWKHRTYSAAMLHAEILARLKHPRPILMNGTQFEARSTPVHFMMTSNHKAPSIEMSRTVTDDARPPSPPVETENEPPTGGGRSGASQDIVATEPSEDVPHVMISLALEDDQRLDINAWENWLAAFPAIAKYVKVQGVFKSHSTLLLLSLPVMVWDLLPEDLACNFIGFVRSNNLAINNEGSPRPSAVQVSYVAHSSGQSDLSKERPLARTKQQVPIKAAEVPSQSTDTLETSPVNRRIGGGLNRQLTAPPALAWRTNPTEAISNQTILNQSRNSRKTFLTSDANIPERPDLAPHIHARLEEYFQNDPDPTVAVKEFLASNLGIETADIDVWFLNRRERKEVDDKLQTLGHGKDRRPESPKDGLKLILPGHLNNLLEILPPSQVLLVDLRAVNDYKRSHIHDAVNLRLPASFIQWGSTEMIEEVLSDDASRTSFNKWYTSKCVVFYDRHVEFSWESPSAEALVSKFRSQMWSGQGFILKGHYREFSDAFDKYIGGDKMSTVAKKYLDGVKERSWEKRKETVGYDVWLSRLENEDRVRPTESQPEAKAARMNAMVQHQKDLEDEFERAHPSLYRKVMALKPEGNWDIKAPIVEHLSTALAKMQEAGMTREDSMAPTYTDYSDKARYPYSSGVDAGGSDDDQPPTSDSVKQVKSGSSAPDDAGGPAPDAKKSRSGRNLLKILRSAR